jgi:hypothetical protein
MDKSSSRDFDIDEFGAVEQSDGSYVDRDGCITWYDEAGQIHREDGPAVINNGRLNWYYLGVGYSFDDWCMLLNIPDEAKMLLRLRYV